MTDDEFLAELCAEIREQPMQRLYRAMYVLNMHKGRPHARHPEFQRKWLCAVQDAVQDALSELPPEE